MIEKIVSRDIRAPREEVFARLVDLESYGSWLPDDSSSTGCSLTSDGPVGEGTTYADQVRVGEMTGEIVEFDPPSRVVFVQRMPVGDDVAFEARQTNVLEAIDGGTRITHTWVAEFFEPFLEWEAGITEGEGERGIVLDALKRACEENDTP